MNTLRNALLACLMLTVAATAADQALLNLVMPDAAVISGMQVANSRTSPFGKYVLLQMQTDNEGMAKFIAETGFDPRTDLTEIVVATGSKAGGMDVLLAGRGVFNPGLITTAARRAGARALTYKGVDLLTHEQQTNEGAIAFLDASTAVMGSIDRVKAAIDRFQTSGPPLPASVVDRINQLSLDNDAWFMTTGPLADFFAGKIADPNLSGAMQGNLLQAVLQASGGIKFGQDAVRISGEALTRSEKDAGALADVVRFMAGLVQLNRDGGENAKKVASLLETMKLTTDASTMRISFTVPESMMEKLFVVPQDGSAKSKGTAARSRTRRTPSETRR